MNTSMRWLNEAVEDLQRQVNEWRSRVDVLARQHEDATHELERAQRALESIIALKPDARAQGPAGSEPANLKGSGGVKDSDVTPHQDVQGNTGEMGQPRPKRVKSTELVAQIVADIGRPVTREEIFTHMQENDLVPPTWGHPKNAFNNALGRAVERRQIAKDRDRYLASTSSIDEPSVASFSPTGGSADG